MAEWLKAAVLKTVVRKYRGFESYLLRHLQLRQGLSVVIKFEYGGVAESAEGARLLSECMGSTCTEGSNPSLSAILKEQGCRFWEKRIDKQTEIT